MINKEDFLTLMTALHDAMWKLQVSDDEQAEDIIVRLTSGFMLLLAGMDEDMADYFRNYIISNPVLDEEQLDMLYDYLISDRILMN